MKIKPILSGILALALLGACKSSTTVVENDLGSFRGNVALVDANGDTLPNYSGATAQIQGTSFQATSSANGDWQINNVPAGIYNIMLTKPGFDTLIIPQYQFSGAGTSFFESTAIQAIPMDSLIYTISNTMEYSRPDSTSPNGRYYQGYLSMSGSLSGPDSLQQAKFTVTFGSPADSSGFNASPSVYVINGNVSAQETVTYEEPPVKSGTVVTVWSLLWAKIPTNYASYTHYQQATSPFSVVRTFTLP